MKSYLLICLSCLLLTSLLQAQEKPEIVITSGHISTVYAINFSPNNRFVITAGMDKTVRIWDRSLCQEFRVLYGHTGNIWKVEYTSDNRYILSIDGKGTLITWNHATGKIVNRIKLDRYIRSFSYISNTTRVLVMRGDEIIELDILTGAEIAVHGVIPDIEIRLAKDGKYLITKDLEKINTLSIYNYKTKTIDGTLTANHKQSLTQVAVSPNGKFVAGFAIANKVVTIWNLETRKIVSEFEYADTDMIEMVFTPNNRNLLVMNRKGSISDYNVQRGKLKRVINESTQDLAEMKSGVYKIAMAFDLAISPDNTMIGLAGMVTESEGYGLQPTIFMGGILFDFIQDKELGRLKGYFKMSTHLSVGSNSKYLINSVYNKFPGIRVWNMKEGDLEQYIKTSGVASASADGSVFGTWVVGNEEKPILTVFDAKTIKPIFESTEVDALSEISFNKNGSLMLTQEVSIYFENYQNNQYFFRVWDVSQKKQIGEAVYFKSTGMPIFKGLKLSPDGDYIIAQTNGSEIVSWEVATGKKVQAISSQIGYEFLLDFVPNSTKILISKTTPKYDPITKKLKSDMTWFEWDYTTGERTGIFNTGKEGILFSADFSADGTSLVTGQGGYFSEVEFNVVVWDWETKKSTCTMSGHHGAIKFVWFDEKGKRVYSTAEDGFIKVWDLGTCKEVSSLIAMDELDYIILSPDNYYKSSKGNNKGISFRFKSNLYSFDQFDVRFNRPDKVLTSLGVSKYSVKLYTKAWEKRLNRLGFTADSLERELALPNIELSNKVSLPVTTEEKQLKLNIKAWDETYKLDRISIYVNDVPAPELKGISLKNRYTNKIDEEIGINLSTGKNLIKVSVFNEEGLESLRETFQITYRPIIEKKPDLYIFTIGVSEFENAERNLKFATKDATDLTEKFESSDYFETVHAETLFNKEATKENVLKASKFLKKANIDDQVIIYISSHGLLDDKLDYYLAMYDVDFDNPQGKGLPYDAVNTMLDGMDCRNRLILIDACHSGEVDKDEAVTRSSIAMTNTNVKVNQKSGSTLIRPKAGLKNSFTYMKTLFGDVSKGTGATVISAAGGYEFALESEDWNNGVFTYAILEGLTSGEADRNHDGLVHVSELKDYVSLQVIKLTDGKQHPTTRTENALNDFVLFKVTHTLPNGKIIGGK
jgi:WD40 repeat protein